MKLIKYIKIKWKQFMCSHKEAEYLDFVEAYDEFSHIRYSVRKYKCLKCGKILWVNGGYDPYAR